MGDLVPFTYKDTHPIHTWVNRFYNIFNNQGKEQAMSYARLNVPKQFWEPVNKLLKERHEK